MLHIVLPNEGSHGDHDSLQPGIQSRHEWAKKAALEGPVLITDRGKPAHVLLNIEEYQRLSGQRRNIVDALSMTGLADIDVDPPHSRELVREADFS